MSMTVAGRGGRPRKWASDADRVRAFRARQRGEAEPLTFDQHVDDRTALGELVERIRTLEALITERDDVLRSQDREILTLERKVTTIERRLASAAAENAHLRAEVKRLAATEAQDGAEPSRPTPQLNRAERRRLDRERRNRLT
jgi:phage shock protein A